MQTKRLLRTSRPVLPEKIVFLVLHAGVLYGFGTDLLFTSDSHGREDNHMFLAFAVVIDSVRSTKSRLFLSLLLGLSNFFAAGTMPEKITAEALVNNIMESLSEHAPKQILKNDTSNMVSSQFNRLFGRQNPLHKVLGGGKPADVLLWRNKKISAGVLATATSIWVLFEWLDFHFLSILCFVIALGMVVQFVWSNASGFLNRSPSEVPRLALPDKLFVNIAVSVGAEVNKVLGFLQDVACSGNLKQFLVVVASLFAAAVFSSWCNFLTLLYIGFVGAHTLPVLYERYEDQVDSFADNMLGQLQHHYKRFDGRVLSKIPTAKLRGRKFE